MKYGKCRTCIDYTGMESIHGNWGQHCGRRICVDPDIGCILHSTGDTHITQGANTSDGKTPETKEAK